MSDGANVIGWLNDIKDVKGKAKQSWLERFRDNEGATEVALLKDFFKRCYEPSITYGITSEGIVLPARSASTACWADLQRLLDNFASRRLTGNSAQSALQTFLADSPTWLSVSLMRILDRDAKCGVGISTINKVWPGLISTFEVMLAAKYDEDKLTFPCYIETKFDGMRMVAIESPVTSGVWDFFTRSGKAIETVSADVSKDLSALAQAIRLNSKVGFTVMFDGELMGESFRETMSKARKKNSTFSSASYHLFDWLPCSIFFDLEEQFKTVAVYKSRRQELSQAFTNAKYALIGAAKLPTSYIVGSVGELHRYYESMRKSGHEGLIIKRSTGFYRPARHHDWMKMKAEETLDLPIVGIERGTGKYENSTGALVVDHKGVSVSVGTGLSDEDRDYFWKTWHMDESTIKGVLIEVGFQEVTPDGSLRHPRYVRIRSDKTTPEAAWS